MICSVCQKEIPDDAKVCPFCGTSLTVSENSLAQAVDRSGDMRFEVASSASSGAKKQGLFGLLFSGVKNTVAAIIATLKTPKKLIPLIVLIVLWIVLMALNQFGLKSPLLDVLKALTFSGYQGNSVPKILGSSVGKGVYVYALTSFFTSFKRGKAKKKEKTKIFSFPKGTLGVMLLGAGIAMILFEVLAGRANRVAVVGALATFYLSARAYAKKGFVRKALTVLFGKKSSSQTVSSFMRGNTLGYGVAAAVCVADISGLVTILGIVFSVIGILFLLIKLFKKAPKPVQIIEEGGSKA